MLELIWLATTSYRSRSGLSLVAQKSMEEGRCLDSILDDRLPPSC